jgi:SAM-dependent methyltransferase
MIHSTSPHALTQSLNLLADTYNYNHWIYTLLRPFLGDHICEVGAGTGNLTRFFLSAKRLTVVEPEEAYCAALRELSSVHLNLTVLQCRIEDYALHMSNRDLADSVVCVNVLEHILEHVDVLAGMAKVAKPEGSILLYVPACPWAFGETDRALGHYRRYSKRGLRRIARQSNLRVIASRYVNFIGAFGWWWCSRIRRRPEIDPSSARFVDRCVPYVSALERLLPPIVGQSLFAVLKKE